MRKTKPPVGWEHVKNCFPVPNELLDFDLPGGSIAVYIFLLRHADRRTGQCHPSTATMAKNLHYCRNTVASYVRLLEERGLIVTERTRIITQDGASKTAVCSTRYCRYRKSIGNSISGRLMLWTEQRNGSEWQDAWSRLGDENRSVFFSHSVIAVTEKPWKPSSVRRQQGITQRGCACLRASDAMNCVIASWRQRSHLHVILSTHGPTASNLKEFSQILVLSERAAQISDTTPSERPCFAL